VDKSFLLHILRSPKGWTGPKKVDDKEERLRAAFMNFDYDLLIIGAGSAGLAAAKRATSYGVHVGIAEQADVGGACINYGCIPEKLMAYAANFSSLFSNAISYGWSEFHSSFDWSKFIAAKDQKVEQIHQLHIKYLKESGVDFIRGRASFVDAHTLDIDGKQITADTILIAVGAQPFKPNIPGIEHTITPKELFQMKTLPKHIAIIGGDYYELVPISVSCIPEAATVGLTEAQALEKFGKSVQCYREKFQPLFYSLNGQDEKTLIKLVVEGKSERVLGAHMVGESASEIIQSIAVAIKLGATKNDFDNNIGIHPSSAEEIFSL
jgi:pyruvate/2-oxoglutarate dehydrogenase complex dihydrolipoamide dehydrogenase (E3) component